MIIDEIRKDELNHEFIELLITMGADIDWKDPKNSDYSALMEAVVHNKPEILEMILKAGADPNTQDDIRISALHLCSSERSKYECFKVLMEYDVNINIQNRGGQTPLHWAVYWNNYKVVKDLIEAGADPFIIDDMGHIPLDKAGANNFVKSSLESTYIINELKQYMKSREIH
jgi:ankyrin repeat protein